MVSALDVSRYILEKHGTMSAMKLQKLAYYSQAWHLVSTGIPLFYDEIKAYEFGPVIYRLWKLNEGKRVVGSSDIAQGSVDKLSPESRELIESVFSYYGRMTAAQLSRRTHAEAPWKDSSGAISQDSIHAFYACQLAETDKHPSLPAWALVVIEESKYDEMIRTAAVPDDVSSLVEQVARARAQLA